MRWNFLTVGDKNPIMFNDMLCECARVEIGPQLGGLGCVCGGSGCVCVWGEAVIFKSLPPLSCSFELQTVRTRYFFFLLKLMKLTLLLVLRLARFLLKKAAHVAGVFKKCTSSHGVQMPSKSRFTWFVSVVPVIGLLVFTQCSPCNSMARCAVIYLVSKEYIHHGEITHLNMTLQQEY